MKKKNKKNGQSLAWKHMMKNKLHLGNTFTGTKSGTYFFFVGQLVGCGCFTQF